MPSPKNLEKSKPRPSASYRSTLRTLMATPSSSRVGSEGAEKWREKQSQLWIWIDLNKNIVLLKISLRTVTSPRLRTVPYGVGRVNSATWECSKHSSWLVLLVGWTPGLCEFWKGRLFLSDHRKGDLVSNLLPPKANLHFRFQDKSQRQCVLESRHPPPDPLSLPCRPCHPPASGLRREASPLHPPHPLASVVWPYPSALLFKV